MEWVPVALLYCVISESSFPSESYNLKDTESGVPFTESVNSTFSIPFREIGDARRKFAWLYCLEALNSVTAPVVPTDALTLVLEVPFTLDPSIALSGIWDGANGVAVGTAVGEAVGFTVGGAVGFSVGSAVGSSVEAVGGVVVGFADGVTVGTAVGGDVGSPGVPSAGVAVGVLWGTFGLSGACVAGFTDGAGGTAVLGAGVILLAAETVTLQDNVRRVFPFFAVAVIFTVPFFFAVIFAAYFPAFFTVAIFLFLLFQEIFQPFARFTESFAVFPTLMESFFLLKAGFLAFACTTVDTGDKTLLTNNAVVHTSDVIFTLFFNGIPPQIFFT